MKKILIKKQSIIDLYNPKLDGVLKFKSFLNKTDLDIIMKEVNSNRHLFQTKEEKYIDNNQDVALIYRGEFCLDGLNNSVFEKLFNQYIEMRETISKHSDIPFDTGNILEVKIIRYPISDLGVAAHRDLSSNVNMITFFNLLGNVNFYTYKNKKGDYINKYLMEAGDISFMRAPRLNEEIDIRPLHGVAEVYTERIVLAIREIRTDLEEETNKGNWRGF